MKSIIEHELDRLLTSPQNTLFEAARYMTLGGGKRLRPLLLLATVSSFKKPLENAIIPACALEMIHTYSLIHDDLPCMDDDDFRRGKPTLHKKYDEATAVLTGDFLLTYAFEVLSHSPGLSPEQILDLVKILSSRSGGNGMIKGQILDIQTSFPTPEELKAIHQRKTADLLTAALEMGGVISGATPAQFKELAYFGEEIGLAFQIIDDVLDEQESEEVSYATSIGVKEAEATAHQLLNTSLHRLRIFPNPDPLKALATSLVLRTE